MDVIGPDGTVRRRELDTVVTRAMIPRSEVSMAVGPRLAARPRQAISSRPVAPGPPFVRDAPISAACRRPDHRDDPGDATADRPDERESRHAAGFLR